VKILSRVALAVLLSFATLAQVEAQSGGSVVPTLTPGMRIRITAPSYRQAPRVGRVHTVTADTVFLREQNTLHAIPLDAVTAVQVNRGSRAMRGAGRGALIGAATGGALVAALVWFSGDCDYCIPGGEPEYAAIGAGIGAVLGLAPGAAIGAVVGSDRWHPLAVDGLAGAARGRGVRAGLVVRH
jgi:hypothetical protein